MLRPSARSASSLPALSVGGRPPPGNLHQRSRGTITGGKFTPWINPTKTRVNITEVVGGEVLGGSGCGSGRQIVIVMSSLSTPVSFLQCRL